jgi:hypothetical protein
MYERTNMSDAGSNAVRSETGDPGDQMLDGVGGRRVLLKGREGVRRSGWHLAAVGKW